jgi:phospholipase C
MIYSRFAMCGALAGAISLSACSANSPSPVPFAGQGNIASPLTSSGSGKIKHVVIIVQENRAVNNLFQGFPGADTVPSGKNSSGKTIELKPVSLATQYVIDHSAAAMFSACNAPSGDLPGTHCRMNGFDKEESFGGPPNPEYVYVPHTESKPYFDMAHEWTLGTRFFTSQLDESFVSHQYIIAGQAQGSVDLPYGYWGCKGGPSDTVTTLTQKRTYGPQQQACFDYTTLGDELDAAKLTWRFYTSTIDGDDGGGEWSAYQAVKHIYNGPDWKNDVITPQKQFLTDVPKGILSNVTWITPTCVDSDHVNCGGGFGPSWVTSLVNVVGESKFWDSTAIFVFWDDWGGLYDPIAPPMEDYDGLGIRTGLLIISPYAKKDHISKVQYEHGSILKFAEDVFGLPRLSASDTRANSPASDAFDFTQSPRKFVPISAPKNRSFFLHQIDDGRPPDYE